MVCFPKMLHFPWTSSKSHDIFHAFCQSFPNETSSFSHHDSISGWWFGTFFIFPYIGNVIIPTYFHIFQRGGSTTHQICVINIPLKWILSNFAYIFSKKCSSFPIRFPPTFSERCPLLAKSLADVPREQPRGHITRRTWTLGLGYGAPNATLRYKLVFQPIIFH